MMRSPPFQDFSLSGLLPSRSGPDLRLVMLVFAVTAAILLGRVWFARSGAPFFADTDDAMRIVMARDLLHGQGWYDLTAHRLNTPFGAELHWSRLIDLPLAILLGLFTPLLGPETALYAAGVLWPMLLLAIVLWLSARLAFRLVGPEGVLPALILPIVSPALTAEFTPGRVDHHSVVIILILAMALTCVEAIARPRRAWLAGLLTATALAIATESLPAIAAAVAVFGLSYVIDPKRAVPMRAFGLSFGLACLVHLAIFRPPTRWLEPACDVISPFYVGAALLISLVFTAVSLLPPPKARWQRFAVLALPGAIGLVGLVVLYPQCLKGPYGALDPWLQANWIANIAEARPWFSSFNDMLAYALAVGVPVLLAIVAVVVRLVRVREGRGEWAVLLVFLLATALVMLAQIRGARLAIMPAMPVAAWLIVTARHRYLARASLGNVLALVGTWLVFAGAVLALATTSLLSLWPSNGTSVAQIQASTAPCLVPSAFAPLETIAPTRIMSPIDLGAHILLYTPHSVVAAPYHRNQRGVRDAYRFFNEPIDTARAILAERGIGLVVLCPAMPEVGGIAGQAEDSFAGLFARNALPDWLTDISQPASPLRVYAVAP
jgi:hypothetical protein